MAGRVLVKEGAGIMARTLAFSKYVSAKGKAEFLSEYVGHDVTIRERGGYTVTGALVKVHDDPDEGWTAVLRTGGEYGYGWAPVEDIAGFTVEGV